MNILKKLKKGSGNYRVYEYLLSGGDLTVASARELGLTNDLRSRISDLRNRYGVENIESVEVEGETGAKYRKHFLRMDSVPQRIKIRVKSPSGQWLHGEWDEREEVVYYSDGRTQPVSQESFEKHLGDIIERI